MARPHACSWRVGSSRLEKPTVWAQCVGVGVGAAASPRGRHGRAPHARTGATVHRLARRFLASLLSCVAAASAVDLATTASVAMLTAAASSSAAECSAAHTSVLLASSSARPARQALAAALDLAARASATASDSCASWSTALALLKAAAAAPVLVGPRAAVSCAALLAPAAAAFGVVTVAVAVVVVVVVAVVDVVGAQRRSADVVAARVSCSPDSSHGGDTGWHALSTLALNLTPASQSLQVWSELGVAAMSCSCPAVHRVTFRQEDQPLPDPQVPVGHGEPANIWRPDTRSRPKRARPSVSTIVNTFGGKVGAASQRVPNPCLNPCTAWCKMHGVAHSQTRSAVVVGANSWNEPATQGADSAVHSRSDDEEAAWVTSGRKFQRVRLNKHLGQRLPLGHACGGTACHPNQQTQQVEQCQRPTTVTPHPPDTTTHTHHHHHHHHHHPAAAPNNCNDKTMAPRPPWIRTTR